jgi:hypothetical protein
MASSQTDHLFKLIKTLSKAEKRNFKLYVNRIQSNEAVKFVQLFDVLDKQKEYNEEAIYKKIPSLKKSQLSNTKAHLYKQLLTSLRLIQISSNPDIQIRENIDYARLLYNKGLYLQSLRLLEKVKAQAKENDYSILLLEILEFEKLIESRHITRSSGMRADELSVETQELRKQVMRTTELSNLALRLYGLYIKLGYARNEKDYFMVKEFFVANLNTQDYMSLGTYEKIYWCQAHVWYNYIIQDFLMCYKYAQKWVDLFVDNNRLRSREPDLYMKGLHNLLAALFNVGHYSMFCKALDVLEDFSKTYQSNFTENSKVHAFTYVNTNRINKIYMEGNFTEGLQLIPILEEELVQFAPYLDKHRVMVLYYKIACLYFGSGDNSSAIQYLNKVINFKSENLRQDIQCFARILNLIAHYELGNNELIEYQLKSVYRFLSKLEDLHLVQQEILRFLRKTVHVDRRNMKQEFERLKDRIEPLANHPYEKRPFLYLDIISWLEAKITGVPVEKIIRAKFLEKQA